MESCSRSQKPARSWEVGRGMALGSWETSEGEYEDFNAGHSSDYKHHYKLHISDEEISIEGERH